MVNLLPGTMDWLFDTCRSLQSSWKQSKNIWER